MFIYLLNIFTFLFFIVLVTLYEEPERPVNALDYIIMKLGVGSKTNSDMDALKAENDELQKRVKDLESQIDDLKARLKTFSEESPS
jgi:hypothetical protein